MEKTCPKILIEYLDYLKGRDIHSNTIKAYTYDLVLFLKYIKSRLVLDSVKNFEDVKIYDVDLKLISQVTDIDIIAFINFLKHSRGNKSAALARKLSSLKSFFFYLVYYKRYLDNNPCEKIQRPVKAQDIKLPKNIEKDDIEVLIQNIFGKHKYRDRAMILLIIEGSLKLSQLVKIKKEDINFVDGLLRIDENYISLSDRTIYNIQKYLEKERKETDSPYLFISQKNNPISLRTVQHIIKKYSDGVLEPKKGVTATLLGKIGTTLH